MRALDIPQRQSMTAEAAEECKRLNVDVRNIQCCVYCGAVFIDAWDSLTQEMRKMKLANRDDTKDLPVWISNPQWAPLAPRSRRR